MNHWDFTGPRLKTNRADCHINELDIRIRDWSNSDPVRFFIETDPETGHDFHKFDIVKPIPDDIPLIIGDAIHNLRSALDFVAVEIITKAGGKPSDAYFPFRESRESLLAALEERKVSGAFASSYTLLVDRIRPYKGGNVFMWSLNRLSNTDKHRLLIPTIAETEINGVSIEYDKEVGPVPADFRIESNESFAVPGKSRHMKIHRDGKPTFEVFFDDAQIAGIPHIPVVRLLRHIKDLVRTYIIWFRNI